MFQIKFLTIKPHYKFLAMGRDFLSDVHFWNLEMFWNPNLTFQPAMARAKDTW